MRTVHKKNPSQKYFLMCVSVVTVTYGSDTIQAIQEKSLLVSCALKSVFFPHAKQRRIHSHP